MSFALRLGRYKKQCQEMYRHVSVEMNIIRIGK